MTELKVGCETTDGLLNVHLESQTCEVCSDPNVVGEVPKHEPKPVKHKHHFALGYDYCDCGARRCEHRDTIESMPGTTSKIRPRCKGICLKDENVCRKHIAAVRAEQEAKRGFWTIARITEILNTPDGVTTVESGAVVKNTFIIYRFLQRMFERQTAGEQVQFATTQQNGTGFAAGDARLLSDMATGSKKFNDEYEAKFKHANQNGLTVRQASYAASRLKKYIRTQLIEIANAEGK